MYRSEAADGSYVLGGQVIAMRRFLAILFSGGLLLLGPLPPNDTTSRQRLPTYIRTTAAGKQPRDKHGPRPQDGPRTQSFDR